MIALQSITEFFTTYGRLRKSPRKTLAALVWALLRQQLLGIAAVGHSLAMAHTPSAKHAIKRVDRFLGKEGIDLEVACGDCHRIRARGVSDAGLDRAQNQRWSVSNLTLQCARPWPGDADRLDDGEKKISSSTGCESTNRPYANAWPVCCRQGVMGSC